MLNFGNKEFRNLQEQVLKNAQDIETLKGRENLQIVIVEELPEVGNPNYIYLVPNNDEEEANIYDEYIWLADSEEYEKIGGVDVDLTNYVTLDSAQSIAGAKTFTADVTLYAETGNSPALVFNRGTDDDSMNDWKVQDVSGYLQFFYRYGSSGWVQTYTMTGSAFSPNEGFDLGTSSKKWKDLYLAGAIYVGSKAGLKEVGANIVLTYDGTNIFYVGAGYVQSARTFIPVSNNTYDLGTSSYCWKNFYITGYLSDGINSITIANIASKVTSTFISGTFDSNGESTIDTEQAGTPEGLFIFTYGNCQCFLRLTSTMIQSADVTPIRISCPMIYNGATSLGWLNITKSGYILILKVTDGTNHVDSGYAWTLTKTNLI